MHWVGGYMHTCVMLCTYMFVHGVLYITFVTVYVHVCGGTCTQCIVSMYLVHLCTHVYAGSVQKGEFPLESWVLGNY